MVLVYVVTSKLFIFDALHIKMKGKERRVHVLNDWLKLATQAHKIVCIFKRLLNYVILIGETLVQRISNINNLAFRRHVNSTRILYSPWHSRERVLLASRRRKQIRRYAK